MASEAELKQTQSRSEEVDALWKELEEKLDQCKRDQEEFAREFGYEFEKYVAYFRQQAEVAADSGDEKTLADLANQRRQLEEEFETELDQAKAHHAAQKQPGSGSAPSKSRRIRNMV
jgi:hypothetical protein